MADAPNQDAPLVPQPEVAIQVLPVEEAEQPQAPLSQRRLRFIEEYLIDMNGQQAAIRAGYAPASAGVEAARLLNDARVWARVEKAKAQRASRVGVTAHSVLSEMSILANSSVDHYFVDEQGNLKATPDAPEGAMRAVSSVKKTIKIDKDNNITHTVEFKLWDKPGSLKLMGRHVSLFADRVELTGPNGGAIETISRVERVIVDPKS